MPIRVTLENIGLTQGGDAVYQHRARVGENEAGVQTLCMVVRSSDLVDALLGEELRPGVEITVVDCARVRRLHLTDEACNVVRHRLPSNSHARTVGLPKASYRRLCHAALATLGATASHLDDGLLRSGTGNATLHKTADAAVFHRDVTGRADQVGLLQSHQTLLGRIVLEAD